MRRSAKVATPATAFTVRVPDSIPPPGFAPRATVIAPVKPGTTLPEASSADTRTGGVITALACVVLGCWVKRSWVAGGGGAAVTLNGSLVAFVRPEAVASRV